MIVDTMRELRGLNAIAAVYLSGHRDYLPPNKGRRVSSTGTFVVTCCLGGCAMAYFVLHPVDADDVQSVWDLFPPVVALAICASAGALTRRRIVLALAVFLGFSVLSILLLDLLSSVRDFIPIMILFGVLTGTVAFSVISRRPGVLITGAVAGVVGVTMTSLVGMAAFEILPPRLTELEPAVFAILVAFGPIMGLALGVPFTVVEKRAARHIENAGHYLDRNPSLTADVTER